MSKRTRFDPYALFEALEGHRVSYVVIGGFARVVHGSGELTRGLDIVPSLREDNLRHLANVLEDLGAPRAPLEALQAAELAEDEPLTVPTSAGRLRVVPRPWGTRGYDDFRIRANRETLATACARRSPRQSTSSGCSKPARPHETRPSPASPPDDGTRARPHSSTRSLHRTLTRRIRRDANTNYSPR